MNVLYTYFLSDIEEGTGIETFHPPISIKVEEKNPDDIISIPETYALHPNYPNPFNPKTTINFDLPEETSVELLIYDVMGRLVKTLISEKEMDAGYHSIVWDGEDDNGEIVPAGMYFYKLITSKFVKSLQMVQLK